MKEQERAAFYQAHKDDPNIWGEAERRDKPRRRRRLSATITVRFSPEEADLIRRMAEARDVSYSDIIREAVKAYAEPRRPIEHSVMTQDYSARTIVSVGRPDITLDPAFRNELEVPTRSLAAMS